MTIHELVEKPSILHAMDTVLQARSFAESSTGYNGS